ncbi:MAG: creatininase family protein [Alphaproteobacteria bacterium]|nr:creatininase family protein [Alphaproteobacteria bacterium]
MRLQLCAWPEVEEYLKTRGEIIVPIGSTEQHGPTGLIGTDALTAEMVAEGVGAATGTLVGPVINVGMAVHHTQFPGTITLRPSTMIAYIQDYVNTLAGYGFQRFFFINGHGGNVATTNAAFYEIYAGYTATAGAGAQRSNRPEPRCTLANWWECDEVKSASRDMFGGREGSHATPSEVAMTWYKFPEHIKTAPLDPPLPPSGRFFGAADYRRRFADGRIGSDPSLATPEKGKRIYEAAVEGMIAAFKTFAAAA